MRFEYRGCLLSVLTNRYSISETLRQPYSHVGKILCNQLPSKACGQVGIWQEFRVSWRCRSLKLLRLKNNLQTMLSTLEVGTTLRELGSQRGNAKERRKMEEERIFGSNPSDPALPGSHPVRVSVPSYCPSLKTCDRSDTTGTSGQKDQHPLIISMIHEWNLQFDLI